MPNSKISLGVEDLIRKFIREALLEGPAGPGVTADPTTGTSGGARDYDLPRGVDILGRWYRSPGATPGTEGDPGRPEDPAEYIGISGKGTPEEAAADLAAPPVMTGESRRR